MEDHSQNSENVVSLETPGVEKVECSDVEDDHSCPKSYRKKGYLCRHKQISHHQVLTEPGSCKTLRPKKKANPNGEAGLCKRSRSNNAELALEDLLSEDEQPDEAAMVDLTVTND